MSLVNSNAQDLLNLNLEVWTSDCTWNLRDTDSQIANGLTLTRYADFVWGRLNTSLPQTLCGSGSNNKLWTCSFDAGDLPMDFQPLYNEGGILGTAVIISGTRRYTGILRWLESGEGDENTLCISLEGNNTIAGAAAEYTPAAVYEGLDKTYFCYISKAREPAPTPYQQ